jgi:RNA polymerase sigma-70 factor (family 1)
LQTQPSYNEKAILQRVAGGDEQAFTILFNTQSDKLAGYLMQLTGSADIAQEILQEAFLRIWKNRENLAGVDHFDNYLFIITRNLALSHFRKMARDWKLKETMGQTPGANTEDTDKQVRYRRLQQLHLEAINQLPARQKEVYLLSREQGRSHQQIAGELSLAVETVKKHIQLALQSVRQFIKEHTDILLLIWLFFML